jgi:ABC-type sugar transport system substrate-binding protein
MRRCLLCLILVIASACLGGCGGKNAEEHTLTVGFMPKLVPIDYFGACRRGAEEAARELHLTLEYNGPDKADVIEQKRLLNQWTHSGRFDCICIACNDPDLIAPALKDAQDEGISVVTYDADSQPAVRKFFVNQASYDDVAHAMVDALADELDVKVKNKVGILTSYKNAPNQREWARRVRDYAGQKYPNLEFLPETEHGENRDLGVSEAKALIQANEDLKGIIGLTSVAVPAAAEAVRQAGKKGVIKVTGVSTPKVMRDYVKDGTVKTVILWNPVDLGYLTVHVAVRVRRNEMPENGLSDFGRLKNIQVSDREVLLGKPIRFTRDNIDQYDF